MDDIVERLRADGSELSIEAADALDQLHLRVIALETQLGTTLGNMTFPNKEDRAIAQFAMQYDIPSDTPR